MRAVPYVAVGAGDVDAAVGADVVCQLKLMNRIVDGAFAFGSIRSKRVFPHADLADDQIGGIGRAFIAVDQRKRRAVIYGKIIDAPLIPQDLVRVKGHYRGGVYVVKQLYSENYGQYIRISRTWQNPDRKKAPSGPLPFILAGLVFLIALVFFALKFLPVSMTSGTLDSLKTAVFVALIAVVVFAGLYLNRFQIFTSKLFLIVFFLIIAVLVAKYIPGGEELVTEIATIVITIIGLVMIVKSIFR